VFVEGSFYAGANIGYAQVDGLAKAGGFIARGSRDRKARPSLRDNAVAVETIRSPLEQKSPLSIFAHQAIDFIRQRRQRPRRPGEPVLCHQPH